MGEAGGQLFYYWQFFSSIHTVDLLSFESRQLCWVESLYHGTFGSSRGAWMVCVVEVEDLLHVLILILV